MSVLLLDTPQLSYVELHSKNLMSWELRDIQDINLPRALCPQEYNHQHGQTVRAVKKLKHTDDQHRIVTREGDRF